MNPPLFKLGPVACRGMSTVLGRGLDRAVWRLDEWMLELWILAVVFFGFGDVVTTAAGLSIGHLVEVGPIAAPVIERYGISALVVMKLVAFAVCVAVWRWAPRPSSVGVPLGLATFGILVTGWNASLLVGAL